MPMPAKSRPPLVQAAWLGAAALALSGVFALYTRPGFLVTLAEQVWSCF